MNSEEYLRELSKINEITEDHCHYLYDLFQREGRDMDDFYEICEEFTIYNNIKKFGSKKLEDQFSAATALSEIDDPRIIRLFLDLYRKGKITSGNAMLVVLRTFGRSGDRRVVQPLIDSFDLYTPLTQAVNIIEALIKIDDPRVLPFLLDILEDDEQEEDLKELAIKGLGKIGDKKAVLPLINFFENYRSDYTWGIRVDIIKALTKIGDPRAIDFFREIFNDREYANVQSEIRESIRKIKLNSDGF